MAGEADFKIKGAAAEQAKIEDNATPAPAVSDEEVKSSAKTSPRGQADQQDESNSSTAESSSKREARDQVSEKPEEGEVQAPDNQDEQVKRYRWCKCICDPAQFGRDHYFLHMDTQESRWEEPEEPYWLWDAENQRIDPVGLQQPAKPPPTTGPDPDYYGYNPKIHGKYDPNAPYAQYHNQRREEEAYGTPGLAVQGMPGQSVDYSVAGTFNRFTGSFQGADKSAERHSDYEKSGRQMGAFFDVDAAANSHDGRSLKEERRQEKLSKKQIKELAEKRRAKKEKKRMDFYKS